MLRADTVGVALDNLQNVAAKMRTRLKEDGLLRTLY